MSSDENEFSGLPPLEGQRPATNARPWPPTPSTYGSLPAFEKSYPARDMTGALPDYSASSVISRPPLGATGSAIPVVHAPSAMEGAPHEGETAEGEENIWNPDASVYEVCKEELSQITRTLSELRVVERQTSKELERRNHLKVLESAKVRHLESHLETHSRQEIRTVYLAASEAEMRAFMLGEQRDHLREKIRFFNRYERILTHLVEELRSHQGGAPQNAPTWSASSIIPAPDLPGGTLAGLPTIGRGDPSWQSGQGISTGALPAATTSGSLRGPGDSGSLARVIQAQENVRQRMAQRLHDGPTQSLANVVLTAELCERLIQTDPAKVVAELAKLKVVVNSALQETRKLIFELRPMTLDDLGLVMTLRRYASDLAAAKNTQITVAAPQGERRLPNTVEAPVFRVAQEAVTNAIEHGHATVISISILLGADKLVLIVEDNGLGFDVEPALKRSLDRETMGIASMQERAELLGGWLKIESAHGAGTRVELSVPN